jgi:tetratricopeptide (TPR) repeat protein
LKPKGEEEGARSERLWAVFLGVWAGAAALRCLYLWQIHGAPFYDLRIGDAEAYHLWARRIADGDWLGRGVFYQAPLYPYLLALVYRIFNDSVTTVRVIQAFLGAGSCALLAAAGIALFGRRGAIAGAALAIYPSAIFLDGLLEKSSLVTFLITTLLAGLCAPATRARWFAAGVTLGLLALTRENALILAVPLLGWIALGRAAPLRQKLAGALAFVAGCTVVLLPVGVRNLALGGEFHLTTAQSGPNFYIGNHAGAKGTYEGLVAGHGNAGDEREDATRLAEQAAGRKLSPAEVSSYWAGRALRYIRSQPIDWLKLLARKFGLTFNAAEISDTESQDNYAEWSWLLRVLGPFDFGVLLALAAGGAVLTASSWRRLGFLYALGGVYALSVVLFYVFARYRFPLVPILMLLAAGGLLALRQNRRLAVAGAAAVAALAFAHLPLDNRALSRATHDFAIASVLANLPANDSAKDAAKDSAKDSERSLLAMEYYQRALDLVPRFPPAQFGIGTLLTQSGRSQDAIPYLQSAVAASPDYSEGRYNLGLALAATGRAQDALQEFNEALRLRPGDPDTHMALAKTLIALDRPGEAIRQYELALDADPRSATAHNNLGATLASQGRVAEAVPHFERALALNPADENARRNLEGARQMLAHHP